MLIVLNADVVLPVFVNRKGYELFLKMSLEELVSVATHTSL